MEDRVARLEEDMKDVKSLRSRLEPVIIRIDATLTSTLPHLATRAEVGKDISDLRMEVTQNISDLRTGVAQDLSELRTEVTRDLSDLRTGVAQGLSDLRIGVTQDLSDLRVEMTQKLSDLPTRTYMWGILGVLITAYGAGLAALAVIK